MDLEQMLAAAQGLPTRGGGTENLPDTYVDCMLLTWKKSC